MRRYMDVAIVLAGIMFIAAGCVCPTCSKAPKAEPVPVVEAPPQPPPAPTPPPVPVVVETPPTPAPAPLPPPIAKKIQDLAEKYPGTFTVRPDGTLVFNSDVTFDSGSAVVKADAKAVLGQLARILADDEVKDRRLTIIGHTDTDRVVKAATIASLKALGKAADNQGLSEARAEAVAAVLQSGGIESSRMATRGKGSSEPVADNRSAEGKARNRRVEIYISPAKTGT
jgi:OmpA-OmpF porin, OOP family